MLAVDKAQGALLTAAKRRSVYRAMRRYAAVTDQTLRAAAEAVSGTECVSHVAGTR